jgi:hypothetical protein
LPNIWTGSNKERHTRTGNIRSCQADTEEVEDTEAEGTEVEDTEEVDTGGTEVTGAEEVAGVVGEEVGGAGVIRTTGPITRSRTMSTRR